MLVIVIMVRSTLTGALQRKNLQSVYIKLLMNHIQLITLTASFELEWPSNIEDLFDSTEEVATVSNQIISFDWFLDQRDDSGDNSNVVRLFYQKMIMYGALPFLLVLGSLVFWSIYLCRKKDLPTGHKRSRIIATVIILFFMVHPNIVGYMFSNFNCKEIDDEDRVIRDLEVQ